MAPLSPLSGAVSPEASFYGKQGSFLAAAPQPRPQPPPPPRATPPPPFNRMSLPLLSSSPSGTALPPPSRSSFLAPPRTSSPALSKSAQLNFNFLAPSPHASPRLPSAPLANEARFSFDGPSVPLTKTMSAAPAPVMGGPVRAMERVKSEPLGGSKGGLSAQDLSFFEGL